MLSHGQGSELRRPLGYAMVGGLIVSQALTLFTTPVVYLYLDRAHYWYMERKAARAARKAAKTAKANGTSGANPPVIAPPDGLESK